MDIKEAIDIIKKMNNVDTTPIQMEALEIAYDAMEKRIKKRVQTKKFRCDGNDRYVCPSCQCLIHPDTSEAVCRFCGQMVDWSDEIETGKVFFTV